MKLLFDIVCEGSSELESLDGIILLMEVVDQYEIKQISAPGYVMKPELNLLLYRYTFTDNHKRWAIKNNIYKSDLRVRSDLISLNEG